MKNNHIFAEKWESTHQRINHQADKHQLLKTCIIELKGLLGLQQTTLQSCLNQIAGLEEVIEQLVAAVKKLEKTICWCHNQLLSLGPHYVLGEEEEVVVDLEDKEEEDKDKDKDKEQDEDGLEYETDAPSRDSYMTPPSTGGHSKPSPHPSHLPTPEGSDPEANAVLHTAELKVQIKSFLEEAEEDMELDDLPLLENITPLQVLVPNPLIPSFIPFAMSTGQCCVPPKSLLWKVYHPYKEPVG